MIKWDGTLPGDNEDRWWFQTSYRISELRPVWIVIPLARAREKKLDISKNSYWREDQRNEFVIWVIPKKGSINII